LAKTPTELPGEHLLSEIRRLGLSQVEISQALEVSRQTINNIIKGRQPVSRAMARKLGVLTGRASDYWLRDSFRPRPIKIEKPSKMKKPFSKPAATKAVSFREFVLNLSRADEPDGKLVDEIKADRSFPAVDSWAELRFHLHRMGTSDENLITARRLWRLYTAN
jgi:addiction module HigA family antidote